jgi:hypothetical protein
VRIFFALLLVAVLCAPSSANQLPRGFSEQYVRTLKQVIEADHEMYAQLETVATRLEQFYFRRHHFPETAEERTAFKEELTKYLIGNPYHPEVTDLIENKKLAPSYAVPIYWMRDESLEREDFLNFLKKADPSWQGEPGTIFILTNGRNIFLTFAASADRLPMRDLMSAEQTPRMICKEIEPKKD